MLLRPQPFDLRQWHFALEKLPRTSEVAAADHAKTGMALNQVAGLHSSSTQQCMTLTVGLQLKP